MLHRYCLSIIILLVWYLQPQLLLCQESTVSSYAEVIDSIGKNLTLGQSELNIQYIKDLEESGILQEFDCKQLGIVNHKLGQAYYILSDHKQAYTTFITKAIPIWNDCKLQSSIDEAHSYYAASLSGQYSSYYDEAISLMNKALELYESDSTYTQYDLARKYHGAGRLYSNIKDYEIAEIYFIKSIDIFIKSEKAGRYLAQAYNDLGVVYQNTQEYQSAIKQYEKSLDQNDLYQIDNLHNISNAYIELEDYKSAEKYALRTYDKALESSDPSIIARTLELIGFVRYLLDNQSGALEAYRSQIDILQSDVQNNETIRYLAKAYENIALCHLKTDNFESALAANQKALNYMFFDKKLDRYHNPIIFENNTRNGLETIDILSTKADILNRKQIYLEDKFSPFAEIDLYYKIDSLFLQMLSDVSFTRSKLNLLNTINPLYEKAVAKLHENYELSNDLNFFNQAYYFASRLKAITLRSSIRKEKTLSVEDNATIVSYQKKIDSLKLIYYNSELLSDSISSKIIRYQRLMHDYEKTISHKYPELLNSTNDIVNTQYEHIIQDLPQDNLLVEYFQGDSSLYTFFISQDTFGVFKINYDVTLQEQLDLYIKASQSPTVLKVNEYRQLANRLYNKLLAPIFSNSTISKSKLLIIPDGILHSIPFEALCTDQLKFLVLDHQISYAYSYLLKKPKKNSSSKGYVGFAPSYTEQFNKKIITQQATKRELILSDIPLAIKEINTSATMLDGVKFLNENASKKAFIEHSKNARIIHLSTHGLVDNEVPENSNLLFSDFEEDFILHSSEISNLDLNSDLVVLSACQSGAGKTVKNVGVQGISQSFLLAGSSSVISSLWDASDYVSSLILPLFFEFYEKGNSKSKSLQLAKINFLEDSRPSLHHPFYWSNLTLIVNPTNETLLTQNDSGIRSGRFVLLLIVVLAVILLLVAHFKLK